MKKSELQQIIREEISKQLKSNTITNKGDDKPGISLITKNINGIQTTLVKVEGYFYYNGVITDKNFLTNLQNRFAEVWNKITSRN